MKGAHPLTVTYEPPTVNEDISHEFVQIALFLFFLLNLAALKQEYTGLVERLEHSTAGTPMGAKGSPQLL